jgi:tetratricopeptide (TPR) repeat protein
MLRQLREYEKAIARLEEGLEVIPEQPAFMLELAFTQGRWAAELLSRARDQDPEAREGHRRARALLDSSRLLYKSIINKDETHAFAHNNLAWIMVNPDGLRELRDPKEALGLAQIAVDLDPRDSFLDTLAWAYYWLNEPVKAIESAKSALRALDKRKSTLTPEAYEVQKKKYQENIKKFQQKHRENQ